MRFKKTTWGGLSAFLLACALLPAPYAGAAETVKAGDVYVTATRVEKELEQVPMSVSVLTSEDVKNSSASTVAELLKDVPGVQILSDAPGLMRVGIRGEDAFRTLILVDGQKLSEHKSMSGTPILIDSSRIERVEVIKGPASVLYGSDAIGGVVNIITKKGGVKAIEGEAFVGFNGAHPGFYEGLSLRGNVDGFKYGMSASQSDLGNLRTPDGEVKDTDFRQTDFSGFASYDFSDKLTAGVGIDYYKGAFDTFSQYVLSEQTDISKYAGPGAIATLKGDGSMRVNVNKWERLKYSAFIEAKDISKYLTRIRLDTYYQRNEKDMSNHLNQKADYTPAMYSWLGTWSQKMDNFANNIVRSKGLSLQTDWQLGDNHYLIAGYELNHDKLDSNGLTDMDISPSTLMPMTINTVSSKNYEGTQTNHALFAAMESSLPNDFTLSYGLRWTHVNTDMNVSHEVTDTNYKMSGMTIPQRTAIQPTLVGDTNDSRPVFNVGLVWTGIEDLALRATWAQGFRVPNLAEKYIGSSMGSETIWGNPDLDPELSDNFELGARWNHGNTNLDTALFLSLARDYISTEKLTEGVYQYANVDEATTYGAEMALSHVFATKYGNFTPYVSATFMRREFDYGNYATYDSGTPELFGRYGVRYAKALTPNCDLRLDLYARSQSGCEFKNASGETTADVGGFTTANFSAGLDFGSEKQFSINAEVLNIFDKRYEYYGGSMLEPGVHANVKLTYKF